MNYRLSYPFKIWLTSTLVGTLLFVIYFSMVSAAPFEGVFTFFIFGFFAALGTSIPAFFILWLCLYLLTKTSLSTQKIRIIIAIVGTVCCTLLFNTLGVSYAATSDLVLIGAYALPVIVSALVYPLRPSPSSNLVKHSSEMA
ncbi:hypothetical protein VRU48_08145 [Pedobacter sp. KR3-3]|uniref:Uncharacterized protein n=1 Tax=Pedobacter albus TaxID=3113905 RepID=A0ABU7I6G8_9SPHI|nr:hypothetical protein [Pedobacter sp. KR3-3]MEE1945074.1 hypothetical protein [Pedobacter sp. KR3-3]